jgi:hypothetical protein
MLKIIRGTIKLNPSAFSLYVWPMNKIKRPMNEPRRITNDKMVFVLVGLRNFVLYEIKLATK